MGTAVMPQLCSRSPQSKGSLGWLNPKVTQIHPNAGKALAVVRRWQISPSFPLEATSPALCSLLNAALDISHMPLAVSYEDLLVESLIKRFLLFFFAISQVFPEPLLLISTIHCLQNLKNSSSPLLFFLPPLAYFLLPLFLGAHCVLHGFKALLWDFKFITAYSWTRQQLSNSPLQSSWHPGVTKRLSLRMASPSRWLLRLQSITSVLLVALKAVGCRGFGGGGVFGFLGFFFCWFGFVLGFVCCFLVRFCLVFF